MERREMWRGKNLRNTGRPLADNSILVLVHFLIATSNSRFQLRYRILSGNNAHLVHLNESSGQLTLSPLLNTNVPKLATMEVSVSGMKNSVIKLKFGISAN